MPRPAIYGYIESLKQPKGLFRTLGEPVCKLDFHGEPIFTAGGNAAVFRVTVEEKEYALKCFTKQVGYSPEVYEFLSTGESPLLCRSFYLPQEIFVFQGGDPGRWHDVAITEWAEGRTLDFEMRKALHAGDTERIAGLAVVFDSAAKELLCAEWAHGDIKPENIIISPHGNLKLIDYDSMFLPSMEGSSCNQTGTLFWRHPRRSELYFNRHIDDYPIAMLSATLHCLAEFPALHARYGHGEIFLFEPEEILESASECYSAAKGLAAKSGNASLYRLLDMLRSPAPRLAGLVEVISSFPGHWPGKGTLSPFCTCGVWGYKDENGNTAIPPLFDSALEFSEGLAAVRLNGCNHFIDNKGICAINCSVYDSVKSFSGGVAAVRKNGLWGYIGRGGNVVSEPQYVTASSVRDGKAIVLEAGAEHEMEIII